MDPRQILSRILDLLKSRSPRFWAFFFPRFFPPLLVSHKIIFHLKKLITHKKFAILKKKLYRGKIIYTEEKWISCG